MIASDYTQSANWLAWPSEPGQPFDVFYLYPTAWESKKKGDLLCAVDYKHMRNKARFLLAYQATAFSNGANLYAPYYRQFDARHLMTLDFEERAELVRQEPWADVRAAFEHYLQNSSRPFILAGHSQGAMLVKDLLFQNLKKRADLRKRLVAAYVIGFSVSRPELDANPEFPISSWAGQTGAIISYNTEAPGVEIANPTVMPQSVAVNPISWTLSEETAPASASAGSYLINRLGHLKNLPRMADAKVDARRGVLVCSTFDQEAFYGAGVELINPFPPGVLHIYDVALYYHDLKANVAARFQEFQKNY